MKFTNKTGSAAPSGGGYDPLPAGTYEASIYSVDEVEFSTSPAKAADYADNNEGWNVQYRIADGQTGANRRLFERIYLNPEGFPSGKDNFSFFRFADAVTNGKFTKEWEDPDKDAYLPDRDKIVGTPVMIRINNVVDTYAWNKAKKDNPDLDESRKKDYRTNQIQNVTAIAKSKGPKAGKKSKSQDTVVELGL